MQAQKNCQEDFATCLEDIKLAATWQKKLDHQEIDSLTTGFADDSAISKTEEYANDEVNKFIAALMQLHRCEDCPLRRKAMEKPHSFFANIHRWHKTWWPGWKIYRAERRSSIDGQYSK